jgi:vibriolysin
MNNPKLETTSVDSNSLHGSLDIGGVHWNSGIANLAFFLLVEGGIHPRPLKWVRRYQGIGFENAAQIFYYANAICLTPNNFESVRWCTVEASHRPLLDEDFESNVHAAWDAVGVPRNNDPSLACVPIPYGHHPAETTWTITPDTCNSNQQS